jgi:hypothetical protein
MAGVAAVSTATAPAQELARATDLARAGKTTDAVRLLEALVAAYPQDPLPYNELALLLYARGEVERARDLLQRAADTDPRYATVLRNLQTVYGVMASRAYERALGTGAGGGDVPPLVSLSTEGTPPGPPPGGADSRGETILAAASPAIGGPPDATKGGAVGAAAGDALVAAPPRDTGPAAPGRGDERPAEPPPSRSAPPARSERPATAPAPRTPLAPSVTAPSATAVIAAVKGWAKAWSSQDITRYLASYGHHFRPAGGRSRAQWETLRRRRLAAPGFIEVGVGDIVVAFDTPVRAVARFRQHYRSDRLDSTVTKELRLSRGEEGWKIVRETVLR